MRILDNDARHCNENGQQNTSERERRLLALINSAKLGMVIIDQSHKVIEANRRFADMLGYDIDEVYELYTWDWEVISPKKDIEKDFENLSKIDFTIETKHRRKDGSIFDVEVNGTGINFGNSEKDNSILCFCQDISERKEAERLLFQSEKKFKSFVENAADMIFTINQKVEVDYISPNCENLLGYAPEELAGRRLLAIFEDEYRAEFLSDIEKAFTGEIRSIYEYRVKHKDNRLEWYSIKLSMLTEENDSKPQMLCNARNITDKKEYERMLEYAGMHDQLTGVYNRIYFDEEINRRDKENAYPLSVVTYDMDDLKIANDTWGHGVGDGLLIECTKLVAMTLRKNDVLARIGGDEFSILLPSTSEEDARILASRILRQIEAYNAASNLPPISISMGIASKDNRSVPIATILKLADDSMYTEKRNKKRNV